jgi:hypothetical protein
LTTAPRAASPAGSANQLYHDPDQVSPE